MATYAIGDIQGCYQTFKKLLNRINYHPTNDILWLAGDLINRGTESLQTLDFIYQHRQNIRCVLGNHDLHFLAVASGMHKANQKDTLNDLLHHSQCQTLVHWLKQQPLFYWDKSLNFAMVHAGISANWTREESLARSNEVSNYLQSNQCDQFLAQMYGNHPNLWQPDLTGIDRLRYITNVFTRMRYCDDNGALELTCKLPPGHQPSELTPWYERVQPLNYDLVFGHWASLEGQCKVPRIYALDTGCVWGGKLTALRLEDKTLFQCDFVDQ